MFPVLALFLAPALAAEPDWSALESDADWRELGTRDTAVGPIAVRAKKVDGVGCVEGRATVDVPAAALLGLTRDLVSVRDWSAAPVAISEEVARHDADHFVLFQVYDAPAWTFTADRYWTIAGTLTPTATGGTYRWERVDSTAYPHARDRALARAGNAVEPPTNYGAWHFTESGGQTDLRYLACADIGGRVPANLVHWLTTTQVPDLVAELVVEADARS